MVTPITRIAKATYHQPKAWLSEEEWKQYSNSLASDEFLSSRIALKKALISHPLYKNYSPSSISVKHHDNGQPYLKGYDLNISLAHSAGWGMGGVAKGYIGVDIEKIRPRSNALLKYIVNDAEQRKLKKLSYSQTELVTLVWTIKEAVIKAGGNGLSLPLNHVRIIQMTEPLLFKVNLKSVDIDQWYVRTEKSGDFFYTIAYEYPI